VVEGRYRKGVKEQGGEKLGMHQPKGSFYVDRIAVGRKISACTSKLNLQEGKEHIERAVVSNSPLLLLAPGNSWMDWSHTWGREAYINRALKKLNLEYPRDSDD
jgi:hypothetical protein